MIGVRTPNLSSGQDRILAMIVFSAVQSFHHVILFIKTSTMCGTTKGHWLTGRPYLPIIAGTVRLSDKTGVKHLTYSPHLHEIRGLVKVTF